MKKQTKNKPTEIEMIYQSQNRDEYLEKEFNLGKWDLENYLRLAVKDPKLGERVSRVWDVVQTSTIMQSTDPYWRYPLRKISDAFWAYFEKDRGDIKKLDKNFRRALEKLVTSIEME